MQLALLIIAIALSNVSWQLALLILAVMVLIPTERQIRNSKIIHWLKTGEL